MRMVVARRILGAVLAGTVALALLPAGPVAGSSTTCIVTNTRTDGTAATLRAAVKAASAGDTLTVRGVCRGAAVIRKDLTIRGIRPPGAARPTLDGRNLVQPLFIDTGATVTVRGLFITRGVGRSFVFVTIGGGIYNGGTLVLRGVRVALNTAGLGGGIFNGGHLTLGKGTVVEQNRATSNGGGVSNGVGATLVITSTGRITGNEADLRAGGLYNPTGAFLEGVRCPGIGVFNANVVGNTAPIDEDCGSEAT